MLNIVEGPLIPFATFTRRLEEILELRRLHVFGPMSDLGGKNLFQFFALGQGPRGQYPHVGPTAVARVTWR